MLFLWLSFCSDTHWLPWWSMHVRGKFSHQGIYIYIRPSSAWAPSLRDGCMTDCWCLLSLCPDVTASVKPHPNRDCWTWQLISYPLPPSSVSCSVCFSITLTTLWFSLGFTHLLILFNICFPHQNVSSKKAGSSFCSTLFSLECLPCGRHSLLSCWINEWMNEKEKLILTLSSRENNEEESFELGVEGWAELDSQAF